jgi:hypothetical protein
MSIQLATICHPVYADAPSAVEDPLDLVGSSDLYGLYRLTTSCQAASKGSDP